MIKLGGLIDLRPQWLGEAEDDKYVSIGFGRYKQKGKEDDENAPTFTKDDSGKYVPTGDKAAKGGDSSADKDTPKVNIFDKPKKDKEAPKKDKKSDTPKLSIDTDDMGDYEGMSFDTGMEVEKYLNKELGLDGSMDINANGAIEYNIPDSTDTLQIGNDEISGKPFSVALANEDGFDPGDTYKAFDNDADAMAYAKELAQKLKGGAEDTPKSEPTKDEPINLTDDFIDNLKDKYSQVRIIMPGAKEKLKKSLIDKLDREQLEKLGGSDVRHVSKMARIHLKKIDSGEVAGPEKDKDTPKSEPKSDSSEKAPRDEKNRIVVPKELGLKGDRFNDDWYQQTFGWVTTKEEQKVINDLIKKSSPQVVDKMATRGLSGQQRQDGEYSQKFIDTIKKHIEKKKNEPSKDSANSRPGKPEVNKAVRETTQELGITPQKLGKEEYESKMSKAAVEALTDSNFHSEARKLIAVLEDNPDFAKDPKKDPNMPNIMSPEYDEWRKSSVYGSEFYDTDDDIDKVAHMASNEASWEGETAVDAIAFDLKMNGSHKLAAKIQSIFDEKNESTMRLTKMEWGK
tara:strand:+ start:339 stop:2045 length:1707 start_codon:yes stop_codon:yes gene_type:complete